MKNKRVFSGLLLTIIGELFMLGIVGCDNGTTTTTTTQYTVTFNANGGQVSPGTMTVEEGKTIDALPTPTKTSGNNTIFQGWYTKDGTDNDWGIPFTISTSIIADITVYAKWGSIAPTKCTITFDPEGGTVNPASIQVNSGDRAGSLPVPENPGFIFGGWYTQKNGEGMSFTEDTIIDDSITVYARWDKSIYGCMYTKKTDTRTDPDGNKTIQYLLSISYDDALTAITAELGNPFRDTSSLFWNDSELTADDSWVILEYNEFHYTEGLTSKTNQVRLIKNNTTGKQWNWQRSE